MSGAKLVDEGPHEVLEIERLEGERWHAAEPELREVEDRRDHLLHALGCGAVLPCCAPGCPRAFRALCDFGLQARVLDDLRGPPGDLVGDLQVRRSVPAPGLAAERERGEGDRRAHHEERDDDGRGRAELEQQRVELGVAGAQRVAVVGLVELVDPAAEIDDVEPLPGGGSSLDQISLGARGSRGVGMDDRRAHHVPVVNELEHRPVGELGHREAGRTRQHAVEFAGLGERAQLRQQVQPSLGLLARVDVAARDGDGLDRAVRTAHGVIAVLVPDRAAGHPGTPR